MAATRTLVAVFLLVSSLSLLWSTNGQIVHVFEITLSLDNSSACNDTSLMNYSSEAAMTEIVNFVESYNLTINVTNPQIDSCSNGIVNASFTSSSQLFTLCQLSSLLASDNSSFAGQEDFLDYTIESTDGRPVNRSCLRGPDNFQTTLIIVLASSGGSALLVIICLAVCLFSFQCVFESKRKKQSKVKQPSLQEHGEIVQLNQYESRARDSKSYELKADQHSVDNYEALPVSDFTTTSCSVQVAPNPPPPPSIGQSVPLAPPPPPVGAVRQPSPVPAQVGNSFAPPPAPPPPPILVGSKNAKQLSKSSTPATAAFIPPPPSLPKVKVTHNTRQPEIEEMYDSSAVVFSSHSANHPFRQEPEFEEIYDTGMGSHEVDDDLGEDYETMDLMQRNEDDEECGDYTEMDFDPDYVNQNPLAKIPENNELYF